MTPRNLDQTGTCTGRCAVATQAFTLAGGCKTSTTRTNLVTAGSIGNSVDLFVATPVVTNTCPAGKSAVPGVATALPTMATLGTTPVVASGVRMFWSPAK